MATAPASWPARGFPEEALKSFDRALALNPNPTDWVNRGSVLIDLGRIDEAIASYDKAIAIDAKSPAPHFIRANALRDAKRHDEALAGYDRAIKEAQDFVPAHRARASLLETMGRADEARASNERAAALEALAEQQKRGSATAAIRR
ncbi:MAG: tetratricopeptide repeat protein [Pseudolabrys sp.]